MSSLNVLAGLLDGSTAALASIGFEVVDVHDVAAAHLLAMTAPAAAGERFIVAGELLWFADVAEILRAHLGPRRAEGDDRIAAGRRAAVARRGKSGTAELAPVAGPRAPSLLREGSRPTRLGARPAVETIIESGRSILALQGDAN